MICTNINENFILLIKPKYISGGYAPDCDVQGFYKPTQCHSSVGVCWCVDKHGVEFANTRTRGKPNCGKNRIKKALFL